MKKLLIINGPNMNKLGSREPQLYGSESYKDMIALCTKEAEALGIDIDFFQSNHEGSIVDVIGNAPMYFDGIIINPAAYSHTSVAILDALKAAALPTVEVHITKPEEREDFRKTDLVASYAKNKISGEGISGYVKAIHLLV